MSQRGLARHNAQRDANEPPMVNAAQRCGWQVTRISMEDWPDLHCGKTGRSVWIEVKMPGEVPTRWQSEQIIRMREWGMEVYVAHTVDEMLMYLEGLSVGAKNG